MSTNASSDMQIDPALLSQSDSQPSQPATQPSQSQPSQPSSTQPTTQPPHSQPAAGASQGTGTTAGPASPSKTRKEEEQARKERSLADFLELMDGYEPLIPDEVTDFYLNRIGFECSDPRLKRLFALAAQKFLSDIASDAFQYARIRTMAGPGGRGRPTGAAKDRSKTLLAMDDLAAALSEYGINARKPEYYI